MVAAEACHQVRSLEMHLSTLIQNARAAAAAEAVEKVMESTTSPGNGVVGAPVTTTAAAAAVGSTSTLTASPAVATPPPTPTSLLPSKGRRSTNANRHLQHVAPSRGMDFSESRTAVEERIRAVMGDMNAIAAELTVRDCSCGSGVDDDNGVTQSIVEQQQLMWVYLGGVYRWDAGRNGKLVRTPGRGREGRRHCAAVVKAGDATGRAVVVA